MPVLGDRLLSGGKSVGEALVGDVQVGQQDVRRGISRVDRQGTLDLRSAGGQLVPLEVGVAERDQDFGGLRVDLQGPGEFLGRRSLVVAGEEQTPLEPGGLPAEGVGLERTFVDLVDDVVERIAQLVPSRHRPIVSLGGLADDQERLGVLGDVGLALIVPVDEPFPGADRFIKFSPRLQEAGLDPMRGDVVGIDLEGLLGGRSGRFPVAPRELQVGHPGSEVRVLGLLRGKVGQSGDRLLDFSLAGQTIGLAEHGLGASGGGKVGLLEDRLVRLLSLGVATVLQKPTSVIEPVGWGHQRHEQSQ